MAQVITTYFDEGQCFPKERYEADENGKKDGLCQVIWNGKTIDHFYQEGEKVDFPHLPPMPPAIQKLLEIKNKQYS